MAAYPVLRRTLVPLLRRRVRVAGLEHVPAHGPFIIAPNHQSYLDPPIVWLALVPSLKKKLWFVTNEYVWRGLRKYFGQRGIHWLGLLPLVTSEKAKVLDLAVAQLHRGERVVIFPEGTRNRTGQPILLHGRTGAARLALLTGAPVVPVGLISPPGLTTGQAVRNFFFSRHPAIVKVGRPMMFPKTPDFDRGKLAQVTTTIMNAIGPLCGKEYRG